MGSNLSALKDHGYTLVSEKENKILVKNEGGDQFVIKKLSTNQGESDFLLQLNHPHIIQHKEIITDSDCAYLVMEHCEGGDLAEKIKNKKEGKLTFSENEILDWIVKICMALKYLHDQWILHKNPQPESIFFSEFGTIRLGEFGVIHQWITEEQTAGNKPSSYVAPEILNDRPYDEKTEIWSLGCVIYELCMLKCAFPAILTVETVKKILTSSYEALPETFSEDLRQLVTDTLQADPASRPSVSEILTRPFIINYLCEKNMQTIRTLYRTLEQLRALADDLERVHFNTTVGSLTGGVVGLAGGITSIVGLILSPFTLGASLIVTGVGIGTAVAGGVTSGVSNITNMVNQRTNRQKIKTIIKEFQEKMMSTVCCIQNIQIAMETLQNQFSTSNESFSNAQAGANAGVRIGRGLGGIPEILRIIEVVNVGKVAAQAARAVRVAEAATGVLSALFVAVDVFFVFLDSREIHNIRQDYALRESQRESESTSNQTTGSTGQTSEHSEATNLLPADAQQAEELKSETMKFVTKIKQTTEELQAILDTLRDAIHPNSEQPNTDN
ncbi:serine/threonine-protein kinase PLK4-like [Megalobrama amblycephala]|uniref:serine/threonine-protein kinase PLK4-like n=1 Tax=Megalobrama amblycephala TaxID=75352 RepID=UPI002014211D|nr:serine/threonine-protein kinase PLK4-like [Megalobrama amblycephala]XP_048039560.1 serine/threonine-protein kinase PLK4-like [Megalobrama amblycephala]XP_048039561.1 serine/threonine-protein kinase PLK4-like [Megalobrama amblycephala]